MGFLALGGLTNEMIVNMVNDRFMRSLEYHSKHLKRTREFYNLFRCIYTGEKPPFKNVVMLPLLSSACWSDIANKVAISLSSSRIIEMDPVFPEAGPSAKRVEALLNEQLFECDILEKMIDMLMSGDVYGNGLIQYGWRKQVMPIIYRAAALGIEYPVKKDVTVFDGPDIENVDILDFLPQAGKKNLDTMLYVCRRYYKDLDDLEEQAYMAMQRGEDPEYDPDVIQELKALAAPQPVVDDRIERNNVWRSWTQFQADRGEKYAKPVEMIDMVGFVPPEYAPDGVRFRIMTMANRMRAIRNIPQPYPTMRKHFRNYCPAPDMHYFHGIGKVEAAATLAGSANKLTSNRLDVLDLALQPAMFASDATELDTQNLVLWPGRVIKVHGEVGEQQIRPVQFDLEAYPMVVNEVEAISRYVDMATGVQRDTIQGLMGGDRQTAREFLGRMEQAKTRLGLEAKFFERTVIEKLADDFRMMNRWWLTLPRMVSLIGSAAQYDPDTGEALPPKLEMVELDDINMDHSIRAIGASQMLSKSMLRQDYMTALQAIQAPGSPMMMMTNWVAFANRFWRAFDMNPSEMIKATRMGAQTAMGGLSPEQQAGPMGDQLEQLAPGILGPQAEAQTGPISAMGAGLQANQGL